MHFMKKNLTLFFVLFSICAQAQLTNWGASIGLTQARQVWDLKPLETIYKSNYKSGFNGQFFLEFGEKAMISHVWELQYNQKGAKGSFPSNTDFRYKTNFVSLNYYFKIRKEIKYGNPYILIGPRIEYLLTNNMPIEPGILEINLLAANAGQKLGIGAAVGVGYEFTAMHEAWWPYFEFIYNPNVLDYHNNDFSRMRGTVFELRLGMKFHLDVMRRLEKCDTNDSDAKRPKKRKTKKGDARKDGSKIFR